MRFYIMKKDAPGALISISPEEKICVIENINKNNLPFCLHGDKLTSENIQLWIQKRSLSIGRTNSDRLLKIAECQSNFMLSVKNKCLTLSDCFWLKEENEQTNWENVNFFDNTYADNVGNILIKNAEETFSLSPDVCTNGIMDKAWRKREGRDVLFKLGKAPFYQEPVNEVICSQIAGLFPNLNPVKYFLTNIDGSNCSICKNFMTQDTEFIPAYQIYDKKDNIYNDVYYTLVQECKKLGMLYIKKFLDEMITFDYLICNTDRHLGNFGFLRDVNTGEFLGPAPLFDNGSSLWFDEDIDIMTGTGEISKPFAKSFKEQLEYIGSLPIIHKEDFLGKEQRLYETMSEFFTKERAERITELFNIRSKNVLKMIEKHHKKEFMHYKNTEKER